MISMNIIIYSNYQFSSSSLLINKLNGLYNCIGILHIIEYGTRRRYNHFLLFLRYFKNNFLAFAKRYLKYLVKSSLLRL